MPQLILEFSDNIIEKENLVNLLKKINFFLCEALPTDLLSCKSRAIKYSHYCIGDGATQNAFAHVNLKIMPGRDLEKINKIGLGILDIMKEYLQQSTVQLNLQITVEIKELPKTYFKRVFK